jgi:hypothetical protein
MEASDDELTTMGDGQRQQVAVGRLRRGEDLSCIDVPLIQQAGVVGPEDMARTRLEAAQHRRNHHM